MEVIELVPGLHFLCFPAGHACGQPARGSHAGWPRPRLRPAS